MRELGPALFLLRARCGTVPGLPALPGEIASAVLAITREVACSMCAAPVLVEERTSLVPFGSARWLHASFGGVLCAALPRGRVRLRLASAVPPPARDGLVPLPLNEWTRVDGGARGYQAGFHTYADAAMEMRQTRRYWRLNGHAVCEGCLLSRRAARRAFSAWLRVRDA